MRSSSVNFGLAVVAVFLAALAPARADNARCSVSVTPVSFGTYYPMSSMDARTTGIVTYNCETSHPITIALDDRGSHAAEDRYMKFKNNRVSYNLYLDAAATMVWGDGTGGSQIYRDPAPPPNQNVSIPIFSRMPGGQREAVGLYDDQIVVKLNY